MRSDLIGGVETVTLGDDEARRRGTQKSVLERANRHTFDVCIELRDRNTVAVYPDVAEAVDHILRGWQLFPELRKVDSETGETKVLKSDIAVLPVAKSSSPRKIKEELVDDNTEPSLTVSDFTEHSRDTAAMHPEQPEFRVFIHGLSKSYLDRILERLNLHSIRVTKNIYDAHALLALKSDSRPGSRMMKLASTLPTTPPSLALPKPTPCRKSRDRCGKPWMPRRGHLLAIWPLLTKMPVKMKPKWLCARRKTPLTRC